MNKITFSEYLNKVRGGWIGKCAGGILGAPIEGYKTFNDILIDDKLFENNFPNDDLDLQILWLDMAKKKGPTLRGNDYTHHWKTHVDFPWNEYGIATLNMHKGLDNPDTGIQNNINWNECMGSPIRSEIWGMLCPGSPAAAAAYAKMDSTVDHTDFSVDAEMFFSACAAIAFFESDIQKIMDQAFHHTTGGETFSTLYKDVCKWHSTLGEDTTKHKIKSKYGDADFTSAPLNVGLTILSLLAYGESFDDILKSINYGHDSDCIIATAAALIGIIKGFDAIPQIWKDRIGNSLMVSPEITGIDIPLKVDQLTEETCKIGLNFVDYYGDTQVTEAADIKRFETSKQDYHLLSLIDTFPNVESGESGILTLDLEAITGNISAEITIKSPCFDTIKAVKIGATKGEHSQQEVTLSWNSDKLEEIRNKKYAEKNFPYTVEVTVNGKTDSFEKGIPFYGSWIMAGPFISDDQALVPMNKKYPDHGLASMPSAAYMNHDKVDREKDFLDWSTVDSLI